jgi:predicted dehydrogenase
MRIAIFGGGSIGTRHATNARALGCDVTVFDTDPRRGTQCHMVGPSMFDAVMICTPAHTHADVARQLRAAGYNGPLFCEKPLVTRLDDGDVFRDWPHPVQMVGYNLRFQPQARAMHEAISPARSVELHCECDMATWPGSARHGIPLLECSHEVDLALWCGAPTNITSVARDVPHYAAFTLGDVGRVRIVTDATAYRREWSGLGAEHGYQWRFDSPEELGAEMYEREIAHFIECATGGALLSPAASFADGLKVVDIIEQARTVTA